MYASRSTISPFFCSSSPFSSRVCLVSVAFAVSSMSPNRGEIPIVAAIRKSEHDVVILGSEIIGLSITRHLLLHSDLYVALIDASVLAFGSTRAVA
ncbi:uncharacterized protein A4U43_C04F21180 [Asparagus officinalis]|uniref:FAD dependent oxidoreductase domain-containing protein n=1 Tax=Asparagus officinalis TaxID=4686 RepID=A0A5P1F2N4_ASPOF|nr:uncharacterized protein A4U43_C04F21180 [Asparagus officinalis]